VTLVTSVTSCYPHSVPCYLKPEACSLRLATLIEFPAIVGGFQGNNLRSDNRMPIESFIVSKRLPVDEYGELSSIDNTYRINRILILNIKIYFTHG
jgi:hypothetical protein